MEGTANNSGGGCTSSGEVPPLPIVLYNADTNNWECVSCVTTFQTEGQLDAHLQLHNELGRSIITTTPTTPEKFSFDNPNDIFQSTSFEAPDFDDFITEFEKITGVGISEQDGVSSETTCPLIVEDRFISGSTSSTTIPIVTTTTSSSTVINVPSVINPLLNLHPPPPPPPPTSQPVPQPKPISQPVPPPPISKPLPPPPISQPLPPPPAVQVEYGPGPSKVGPVPSQPFSPKPISRPRKRYPCSQCSKDFSRPSYLKKHEETQHHSQSTISADVSKLCPICSKAFSTQWHLTQHMKTHTSAMSYCCAHCGREFADRENMQKHMELHKTEVTNSPTKIMDQSFSKLDVNKKSLEAGHALVNVNVVGSLASSKFKSDNFKIIPNPPAPPVVDLEEETDVILETDLEPEVDDDEDNDGFECAMCDKIFDTIKQLRIHERMMHEDKLMEVDKHVLNHHEIPNPHKKFNSIANTLLKNESLLRSLSMSRRNKRKRWSLSTMEKYEYCANLICDIKKKLNKALKILEPGSDRRIRHKRKKKSKDKDNNEWSCKVTSRGIKIFNQRKFQSHQSDSMTTENCSSNIYACIVCGLKVNSVTILKRHVLAEHANIIGGPPSSEAAPEVRFSSPGVPPPPSPVNLKPLKSTFVGPLSKSPQKLMGSPPKTIGPTLPKASSTSWTTINSPTKTISSLPKPFSKSPQKIMTSPSKPIGPLSKSMNLPFKSMGPVSKHIGLPLKPMGPPPLPIRHSPQKSRGNDDDLIVVYETINLNKSPTKSPLKPGTGKRTTNFAANQAKKKAERIANQVILEKAQLAEMESRDKPVGITSVMEFERHGIFGRVNIRDFQGIRSLLGPARAVVMLETSVNSKPKLPTPFQRKSEQSLLNDRITIASASEQARKDRRKSMLLNQPPPFKSSITTRSKSLIKMEKELRVVLTRIDDDSFDFTELLFLNKMC